MTTKLRESSSTGTVGFILFILEGILHFALLIGLLYLYFTSPREEKRQFSDAHAKYESGNKQNENIQSRDGVFVVLFLPKTFPQGQCHGSAGTN